MDWQNLLFSFTGRINRAKYWLGVLVLFIYWIVVIAVISALFGFGAGMGHFGTPFIIMLLAIIPALLAGLAIGIKRLHDRNKSGWWLLLFWVVPGLLQGGGMGMGQESAGLIATLAGAAISIWGFVEIGCLRGTTGPNGYGPDPLPAES